VYTKDDMKVYIIKHLCVCRSSDPLYLPQSANYVRSLGITTFAIGIGNKIKQSELRVSIICTFIS